MSINFENSNLLWLLLLLPIIFLISKISPNIKQSQNFAPIFILKKLKPSPIIPNDAPLYIKIIRTFFIGFLILGLSGPFLKDTKNISSNQNPLLFIIENDVAGANDFEIKKSQIKNIITNSNNKDRDILFIISSDNNNFNTKQSTLAIKFIDDLEPLNYSISRKFALSKVKNLNGKYEIHYFANNIASEFDKEFYEALNKLSNSNINLHLSQTEFAAITKVTAEKSGLKIDIFASSLKNHQIIARDINGKIIANTNSNFNSAFLNTNPQSLRQIYQLEIKNQNHAAKTHLIDGKLSRPFIAATELQNNEQKLVSDNHFIWSALNVFGEVIKIDYDKLLSQKPSAIVFADIAGFSDKESNILQKYMENGGIIIRFLGPKALAKPNDIILSAPISQKIHQVAQGFGVKPVFLKPFENDTILKGIDIPDDLKIQTTIDFEKNAKPDEIIALLSDGAPYISVKNFGKGKLYIFHTNAAPIWSNIGLSNLQLSILDRIIKNTSQSGISALNITEEQSLKQSLYIDNNGNIIKNPKQVYLLSTPLKPPIYANAKLPPGLYETNGASYVINIGPEFQNSSFQKFPNNFKEFISDKNAISFSYIFLSFAFILLFLDIIIAFLRPSFNAQNLKFIAIIFFGVLFINTNAMAQNKPHKDDIKLAFILTPDAKTNAQAQSGLKGLANTLEERTNIEPSGTIAVDIENDELAKHPILYWLLPPNGMTISQNAQISLNKYMQNGGIIFIDTRGLGMENSRAQKNLQNALIGLKIPPLERVPPNHVLRRSFYLLQNFQGFYKNSSLWVENSISQSSSANDGVSPIIISDGDFARLWAKGASRSITTMFDGNMDDEFGFRAGINIYIYALTGQYKGDQIHIKSLLDNFNRGKE